MPDPQPHPYAVHELTEVGPMLRLVAPSQESAEHQVELWLRERPGARFGVYRLVEVFGCGQPE